MVNLVGADEDASEKLAEKIKDAAPDKLETFLIALIPAIALTVSARDFADAIKATRDDLELGFYKALAKQTVDLVGANEGDSKDFVQAMNNAEQFARDRFCGQLAKFIDGDSFSELIKQAVERDARIKFLDGVFASSKENDLLKNLWENNKYSINLQHWMPNDEANWKVFCDALTQDQRNDLQAVLNAP